MMVSSLPPLVADGGELRLARRVASLVYGRREVTWPEDVADPEDDLPDGREFGWVAKLDGPEPGLSERRFVRADVSIDAVEKVSDVEQVLDDAALRAGGDVYYESLIEGKGLGLLKPGVDFDEGDLVDVRFWGRILKDQLVTSIDWDGDDPSVKLGGQSIRDTDSLARARAESLRLIRRERAERKDDVGRVDRKAESAKSTADEAMSAVNDADGVIQGEVKKAKDYSEQSYIHSEASLLHSQKSLEHSEASQGFSQSAWDANEAAQGYAQNAWDYSEASHVASRASQDASEKSLEHSELAGQHSTDARAYSDLSRLYSLQSQQISAQSVAHSALSIEYSEESYKHSQKSQEYSDASFVHSDAARVYSEAANSASQQAQQFSQQVQELQPVIEQAASDAQAASQQSSQHSSDAQSASEQSSVHSQAATDAAGLSQESLRLAEIARDEAETSRRDAEAKRDESEAARRAGFAAMAAASAAMAMAEQARAEAEEQRRLAENERKAAEDQRRLAETARAAAESARNEAEQKRAAAETERSRAESARSGAESARNEAEQKRAAAESERKLAETARSTAETHRNTAETHRDNAEESRKLSFNHMVVAQNNMAMAEKQRAMAERERALAEEKRAAAEEQRRLAEGEREKAETAREQTVEAFKQTQNEIDAMQNDAIVALEEQAAGLVELQNRMMNMAMVDNVGSTHPDVTLMGFVGSTAYDAVVNNITPGTKIHADFYDKASNGALSYVVSQQYVATSTSRAVGVANGNRIVNLMWARPSAQQVPISLSSNGMSLSRVTWTDVPGLSRTASGRVTSGQLTIRGTWNAANRGSTYGIRVLVGTSVFKSFTTTNLGPLSFLSDGESRYTVSVANLKLAKNQTLKVQVYSSASGASQRSLKSVTAQGSWIEHAS